MINTVSITDLKQNTAKVVKRVKEEGKPVVILQRSEPTAVLIDPKYYETLQQALEDLEDLMDVETRKNEPVIPFDKYFEKRFKRKFKIK